MALQLVAFVLSFAAITSNGSPRSDRESSPNQEAVSASTVIAEFNKSNEDSRAWAEQSPLTEQELIAALVHEKKVLSTETQQMADEIIENRTLPSAVHLKLFVRHFADRHSTYVYQIKLVFDKGPVRDELGKIVAGKRRVENLTIRKQYLATQKQQAGQKLKSLKELLAESNR